MSTTPRKLSEDEEMSSITKREIVERVRDRQGFRITAIWTEKGGSGELCFCKSPGPRRFLTVKGIRFKTARAIIRRELKFVDFFPREGYEFSY